MFGSQDRDFWEDLNKLFTVVCQIDEQGRIVQSSSLLRRFVASDKTEPPYFFEIFQFKRPNNFDGSFIAAKQNRGKLFLGFSEQLGFAIRGQILDLSKQGLKGICFVGVPWLWWIQSNNESAGLTLADFPIHDVQMDQLFFMTTQQVMVEDLQTVNEELIAAKAEVDQLNATRSNHFRHISHEMRTPLNGIISALTLLNDEHYDGRTQQLIKLANHSASRLLEVINFTLDSAALEAGDRAESDEIFDLNRLIDESLTLVQARALEKGIELRRDGHRYFEVQYQGRLKLLRQVLSNLLGNAIKFTEQGKVVVSVTIAQSTANGVDRLSFSVADEGPGIPKEYFDKVFEPFATGVTQQTQGSQGTGLGLSIVKRFVESLGGRIVIESTVGEGATFSFDIPLRQAGPLIASDEKSPANRREGIAIRGHILLVDDMQTNLMLNAKLLETLGLTVDSTTSGPLALEKIASTTKPYDLILMDLDMREMGGVETARRIRADCPTCTAPIIALTAHDTDADRRAAVDAGMAHFLVKPLIRDDVAGELQLWLPAESIEPVWVQAVEPETNEMKKDLSRSASTGDASVFQPGKIETLVHDVSLAVTRSLVDKFLSESAQRWDTLQAAINKADNALISRESHTLGSSCLTFGVENAGLRFRQMEARSIAGEKIALRELADIEKPLGLGIQQLKTRLSAFE